MNVYFFTTKDPSLQGDFQENCILIGLRKLLGEGLIDCPKKDVLYGNFNRSPKEKLHGGGFTLYTQPIEDIINKRDPLEITENDVIIYGVTDAYGITDYPEFNKLTPNVWYLDGHDDPNIRKTPCFKRELFNDVDGVWPTGFGIPDWSIRPIDLTIKKKMVQLNAPDPDLMDKYGTIPKIHFHPTLGKYIYSNEKDYYDDMAHSWFGITTKRGGWDSLRTYEIMAAGSLLIFKDYDKKPPLCSPQFLPCFSYSSIEELDDLMNRLVVNGKPTLEYLDMLVSQREWLYHNGTCFQRAWEILKTISLNKK
jgi:hypothetical protein